MNALRAATLLCAVWTIACSSSGEQGGVVTPAAPVFSVVPPDRNVSRVARDQPGGDYTLDPRHTSVIWRTRHWGLALYTGRFDTIGGSLRFDPADPARSTVVVRIPVNSVSTGLLNRAGERAFDRDLAAYLGGETHPEIVFESRAIELTSGTSALIHGDLSFNGRTHPATIETTFEGGRVAPTNNRHTLGFAGRMVIRRSSWIDGQIHNSAAPGEDIEILINAEFARAAGG